MILVKHAQPVLEVSRPPREWQLGPEGEAQSREVGARLKAFLPFVLVSSQEPKALRTAEIIAADLGIAPHVVEGLEEFDRPAMPIVSREEHERVNARIFESRSEPVLGRESANTALARFSAAIARVLDATPPEQNLVVIAHGTVIALFVEQHAGGDAFEIWKRLACADAITVAPVVTPIVTDFAQPPRIVRTD